MTFEWPDGLTSAEVAERRPPEPEQKGRRKRTKIAVPRGSVFSVFNLNLVGLSLVQLLMGSWKGALVTTFMLLLNTTIRFVQRRIADKRMERFRDSQLSECSVIRDGKLTDIPVEDIVDGDALVTGPGDQLFADGTLLGPGDVVIGVPDTDEDAEPGRHGLHEPRELQERTVHPGQRLTTGSVVLRGRAVYFAELPVIKTTSKAAAKIVKDPKTRLEVTITRILTGLLVVVVVYLLLLLATYIRVDVGEYGDALRGAAPVIFSLIPTGMYLMIMVSLAAGRVELAREGGVVRTAQAVETLAETDIVCFTELGALVGTSLNLTLCEDESGKKPSASRVRQTLGDIGRSVTAQSPVIGLLPDSYEGSLRVVQEEHDQPGLDGWSAVTFGEKDASGTYVLGLRATIEPNLFYPVSVPVVEDDGTTKKKQLVLAHRADAVPLKDERGNPRLPDQLIPLGVVTFSDDPDMDTADLIRQYREAGVSVKAFGGNVETVLSLLRAGGMSADEVKEIEGQGTITGQDLEQIPQGDWAKVAHDHVLFGGLTPSQAGDLIRAMREGNDSVTVVGDGTHDLPALGNATLAVAQPTSTQAAVSLADMVLTESDPGILLRLLRKGQNIINRLLDVMKLNLTLVLATGILILLVRVFSVGFPHLSSQGSLISLLSATIPSIYLGFFGRPRKPKTFKVSYAKTLLSFTLPAGLLLALVTLGVYQFQIATTGSWRTAQLGVTYTLIYAALALNLIIRPERRFNILIWSLAIVAIVLPFSSFARWQFKIKFMNPTDYLVVLVAVMVWFILTSLLWRLLGVEENEALGRGRARVRRWHTYWKERRRSKKQGGPGKPDHRGKSETGTATVQGHATGEPPKP